MLRAWALNSNQETTRRGLTMQEAIILEISPIKHRRTTRSKLLVDMADRPAPLLIGRIFQILNMVLHSRDLVEAHKTHNVRLMKEARKTQEIYLFGKGLESIRPPAPNHLRELV